MDPAVENDVQKREIYDLLDHAVNFGFYNLINEIDRAQAPTSRRGAGPSPRSLGEGNTESETK